MSINQSLSTVSLRQQLKSLDWPASLILLLFITITIVCYPYHAAAKVTSHTVFYYGWITAIFTGLGVVPFYFVSNPKHYYLGISNAIACGMMVAASYGLIVEGFAFNEAKGLYGYHPGFRATAGFLLGFLFIILMKKLLDGHDDMKLAGLSGASAQKMILIIVVMTLHSVTEGIGIGVSFGGSRGATVGKFISLSLAVHNIPEGLAVGLILNSRGVSTLRTVLWAIITSIPQPFTALPAFIFVENFIPLLPAGLGFAAGAMMFVAIFELLPEAIEDCSVLDTSIVSTLSFGVMYAVQEMVKVSV